MSGGDELAGMFAAEDARVQRELAALRAERDAAVAMLNAEPGGHLPGCGCYGCKVGAEMAAVRMVLAAQKAKNARSEERALRAEQENARLQAELQEQRADNKRQEESLRGMRALQAENTRLTGGVRGVVESNTLRERSGWSCSTCMHHTEDSDHGGKEGALAALHWPHCAVPALRDLLATSDKNSIRQPPRTTADEYSAAHDLADPSRPE